MEIRPERPADAARVRTVNEAAFEGSTEADLVELLHRQASPVISFVAEDAGEIVGHILFSPVTLLNHESARLMGLAPMAVAPSHQRRGIGSALVGAGLDACRRLDFGAVVVLGHPNYYPRFGFTPASRFGICCEYSVPEDVFMALELEPGYLTGKAGTARYHAAFGSPS
jgi:putative acetyltransferase